MTLKILEETAMLVKEKMGQDYRDISLEKLTIGLFFTGVKLSNGVGGICYTPIKDIPQAVCCPSSAGSAFNPEKTNGMPVEEVLKALTSTEPIKTAVAIATLNALSNTLWQSGMTGPYTITNHMDAQDAVHMPIEKTVAVVGAFVPTLQALKRRGGTWWVIEQEPKTLKEDEIPHYVPAEGSEEIIGKADVLIITGVTLINHTLDGILSAAKPNAEIAVMGPTASSLPEPLFKRGVRIVGGVRVTHPDALLEILAAGGSGYHFFDKYADRIVIIKGNAA
ncbi:MAG: DUF364 domain-containing protein [Pseudomonadota bacterium]